MFFEDFTFKKKDDSEPTSFPRNEEAAEAAIPAEKPAEEPSPTLESTPTNNIEEPEINNIPNNIPESSSTQLSPPAEAPIPENTSPPDEAKTEEYVEPQIRANQQENTQKNSPGYSASVPVRIGDRLISLGLISKDQLEVALKEQKASGTKKLIGQMLVDMGFITESALGEVLAETAGTDKFDPTTAVLDADLIRKIPKDIATRQKIVTVGLEGNNVILAMADVYNVIAIDQVKKHFSKTAKIKPIYCTEGDINDLIEKYYDYETSIDGIIREIETGIVDKTQLDGKQDGYINPTVRLVNAFLVDAIRQGASDIHFEPEGTFLRVRYRIDGQLIQIRTLHRDYWSAIAVRVKIMSGMNIAETRLPQDGRINYNVAGRDVDFRVATQPTIHGENIVMRLLDKKKALMPLDQLGFLPHNEALLKKLLKRPEGIIIVTGPTGSGKTTTLYSVLEFINSVDVNIMTLEDPVEYQLSLIRQSNVREGSGMGFADGIKSIMRQDPDIVFIGEVRDETTANMAIRAAMTGHKVFTTLHTNDALGIIPRLFDIGVTPELLAGSLICGVAQRLARRLCKHCKEEYTASADDCKVLGVDPTNPPKIFRAVGCSKCFEKGYKGRVALHEIMPINKEMDELIATHSTRNKMRAQLMEDGFIPMVDDAASKVLSGMVDVPEMIRSVDCTERLD
ncbi:MAG: secretion system protein E [Alphaproteobacteria bacterium CG11_big_fil_rev_8_21_14_0_20_44_7]|nr:MAG: secretion system protein E [Alphaproteobacteria bacterium CG11_big_fil_rev_8_21_14_0_20_44_7]